MYRSTIRIELMYTYTTYRGNKLFGKGNTSMFVITISTDAKHTDIFMALIIFKLIKIVTLYHIEGPKGNVLFVFLKLIISS